MTPLVAFVAIGIAYRQWKTAQNKLKLDLFDRRFAIYFATREFIKLTLSSTAGDGLDLTYLQQIRLAQWLFGHEICAYLENTVWSKAVELDLAREEKQGSTGSERRVLSEKTARLSIELADELTKMNALFSSYLALQH